MTYRQTTVERKCEICQKQIEKDQWMLDLFRTESSLEGSKVKLCWVHEDCAKEAIQTWLKKKWKKEADSS